MWLWDGGKKWKHCSSSHCITVEPVFYDHPLVPLFMVIKQRLQRLRSKVEMVPWILATNDRWWQNSVVIKTGSTVLYGFLYWNVICIRDNVHGTLVYLSELNSKHRILKCWLSLSTLAVFFWNALGVTVVVSLFVFCSHWCSWSKSSWTHFS